MLMVTENLSVYLQVAYISNRFLIHVYNDVSIPSWALLLFKTHQIKFLGTLLDAFSISVKTI